MPIDSELLSRIRNNDSYIDTVDLSDSQLEYDDVETLSAALVNNTNITILNLSDNDIGNDGISSLADVLTSNKSITELYLSDTSITDDVMECVAQALKSNTTLSVLDISNNDIGNDGIEELTKVSISINSIDLSTTSFDDIGASFLAHCIARNESVTNVEIGNDNSGIKEQTKIIIKRLIQLNQLERKQRISMNMKLFAQEFDEEEESKELTFQQKLEAEKWRMSDQFHRELRQERKKSEELKEQLEKIQRSEFTLNFLENTLSRFIRKFGISDCSEDQDANTESSMSLNDWLERCTELEVQAQELYSVFCLSEGRERVKEIEGNHQEQQEALTETIILLRENIALFQSTSLRSLVEKLFKFLTSEDVRKRIEETLQCQQLRHATLANLVFERTDLQNRAELIQRRNADLTQCTFDCKVLDSSLERDHDELSIDQLKREYARLSEMQEQIESMRNNLEQLENEVIECAEKHPWMADVKMKVVQIRDQRHQRERFRLEVRQTQEDHTKDSQKTVTIDRFRTWLKNLNLLDKRTPMDFDVHGTLSKSARSKVMLAMATSDHPSADDISGDTDLCVLKRVKWSPQTESRIRNEIKCMRRFQHSNILSLRSVLLYGNDVYLVTDYCKQDNLLKYVES